MGAPPPPPLPRIDTDQLQAFQRVVREGSFSRAAVALGVGQPAISARIAALEAAVGGPLFTRGRRVALTALGDDFLGYAGRALDVLGAGVDEARLVRAGERGRCSLAALGSLADGLVGPALASLLAAHPALAVTMRSGDHEQVVAMLCDGVVELGIVLWPCHEAAAANLTALARFREPVLLVASPRHPLAAPRRKGKPIDRAELVRLGRPLLRLRWWKLHHPALEQLAEDTDTAVEVPKETALRLIVEARAVGFFPRTLVADELALGRLICLDVHDLPPLHRDSALVRRARSTPLAPASQHLVAAITAQAARMGLAASSPRTRPTAKVRAAAARSARSRVRASDGES